MVNHSHKDIILNKWVDARLLHLRARLRGHSNPRRQNCEGQINWKLLSRRDCVDSRLERKRNQFLEKWVTRIRAKNNVREESSWELKREVIRIDSRWKCGESDNNEMREMRRQSSGSMTVLVLTQHWKAYIYVPNETKELRSWYLDSVDKLARVRRTRHNSLHGEVGDRQTDREA